MPAKRSYKRKSYRRSGSRLPYGIAAVARSAARAARTERQLQSIVAAEAMFKTGTAVAPANIRKRRELALEKGQGMYTGIGSYGSKVRNSIGSFFKKNKTAQTFYDQAMAGAASSGTGMYTGSGEYEAGVNGLISSKSTMDIVPLFQEDTDQGVVLSKREYVSEIYGPPLVSGLPSPFTIQTFSLNPGLERTFPWLSQVAANYDEYEINQLIFTFKSTTTESGNQVNGQVGTVIMATNYNAAAKAFDDKFTMMQYDKANSGRLTESLLHGVECDPDLLSGADGKYVRTNPVVANQDLKTYDHGLFQIAIANCTANLANQSLGELWVTYTVTLRKPKFYTGKGLAISKDIFLSFPNATEDFASPMGRSLLKGQQNNIGCSITAVNGTVTIVFPAAYAGFISIDYLLEGTGIVGTVVNGYPFSQTGNITQVNDIYGPNQANADAPNSYTFAPNNGTVGNAGFIAKTHIQVQIATNGVDNTWTFVLPAFTTLTQQQVVIQEFNSGFSYVSNNLGASQAPIWVTSTGLVVVP
jgi:Viral coat protein (S domain)